MKKTHAIKVILILISMMLMGVTVSAAPHDVIENNAIASTEEDDYDPLVDIEVTVEIQKIRSLEKRDKQVRSIEKIDWVQLYGVLHY